MGCHCLLQGITIGDKLVLDKLDKLGLEGWRRGTELSHWLAVEGPGRLAWL